MIELKSMDMVYERFHKCKTQKTQLKEISTQIRQMLTLDLPPLEQRLATRLLAKLETAIEQPIDIMTTGYPPLTVKLRPSAVEDGCFVTAIPIYNFISLAKRGIISSMKYNTEEHETARLAFYDATLPPDSVDKSLLFAAAPENDEPYVTLATIPQRAINILRERDTDFPFGSLLVSDDNAPSTVT
ncbi:MAG: hypothetical protein JRN21_09315 [Nitrososphaerota archaeon]|nr:hypothetical protein [Nitrososphaerota archaeon]